MNWRSISLIGLLAALLIVFAFNSPLDTALLIGGDDQFELCKAQLLNRAPGMAGQIHNDHPWLHTIVIARAFSLLGEHAAIPRVLCLCLTFCLALACWHLLGKKPLECILFLCVYFTSTQIPSLTASAMLEPPAMTFAVLAVACSYSPERPLSRRRAYLSGGLIGIAICVKLTSLLVGPAWLVLLWRHRNVEPIARMALRVSLGCLAVVLAALAISPDVSFQSLLLSHWRAQETLAAEPLRGHAFAPADVFNDWTILAAVFLGIAVAMRDRGPASAGLWFAASWLLTDFAIHWPHKPWWAYYAIHFHIPLAMLAASGAGWVIRHAWNSISTPGQTASVGDKGTAHPTMASQTSASLAAIAAAALIACWSGIRLPFALDAWQAVHDAQTADENVFIPILRQYAGKARWIYASDGHLTFHSGILQPPELILRTYKRQLSGEVSKEMIYQTCLRYKPELLVLYREGELRDARFQKFLKEGNYVRTACSETMELWASPELHAPEIPSTESLVGRLGL